MGCNTALMKRKIIEREGPFVKGVDSHEIGRASSCDIDLTDNLGEGIRIRARIEKDRDGWNFVDLNGTNDFVNKKIKAKKLGW